MEDDYLSEVERLLLARYAELERVRQVFAPWWVLINYRASELESYD